MRKKSWSVSEGNLQEWRPTDELPRGPEAITGTLTTTGREAVMTLVAGAEVEEDSLVRVEIRDLRGQAPVTSINPAAVATVTGAEVRMIETPEDQGTSLEVAEEGVVTTITGETTTGGEAEVEETTGMNKGAVMVMETIPMEDMEILLMDMATPPTDTATPPTDTAAPPMDTVTPLTDTATLGQAGSLTLDLEEEQEAETLPTRAQGWSPTGRVEGVAGPGGTQGAAWVSSLAPWVSPWGALASPASECSPSEAPHRCSPTSLVPEA